MSHHNEEPDIWVVPMSLNAFLAARDLEEACVSLDLDFHLEGQLMLGTAETETEIALWREVFEYVAAKSYSLATEPVFFVIDCS